MDRTQFEEITKRTLRLINQSLKETTFLSRLGVTSLTEENIKSLPITTYVDYGDIVEKEYNGEKGQATNDEIVSFLLSGGTSGVSKKIGILTDQMSNSFFSLAKYIRSTKESIIGIPRWNTIHLVFSDPFFKKESPSKIRTGLLSTFWFDTVPDMYSTELGGRESHYHSTLESFLNEQVEKAISFNDLHEIYAPFPYVVLSFLERAEKVSGKKCHVLWPNLKLITSVFQCSFRCYVDRIKRYLPGSVCYDPLLGSTEGFYFGVNLSNNEKGCFMLNPYSSLYEFLDLETSHIYDLYELRLNKDYVLLITNLNGYVRYNTKDTVKVTEWRKNIPLFELVSRGLDLNILNERVTEEWIHNFFANEIKKGYITFIATVRLKETSYYEIVLISDIYIDTIDIELLSQRLDERLKEDYVLYLSGRTKQIIGTPQLILRNKDNFDRVLSLKANQNLQAKYSRIMEESIFLKWKNDFEI